MILHGWFQICVCFLLPTWAIDVFSFQIFLSDIQIVSSFASHWPQCPQKRPRSKQVLGHDHSELFLVFGFRAFCWWVVFIGYNMIGHVAVVTMVFVTWWTFRSLANNKGRGVDYLRMPDRSSRCDEYTDIERDQLAANLLVPVKV